MKNICVRDVEAVIQTATEKIFCMVTGRESILGILLRNRISFDPDKLTVNGFYLSNRAFSKPIGTLPLTKKILIEVN